MSQQQHPRLRQVDFAVFPVYAESTTHDTKTGYTSYARGEVVPRESVVVAPAQAPSQRLSHTNK